MKKKIIIAVILIVSIVALAFSLKKIARHVPSEDAEYVNRTVNPELTMEVIDVLNKNKNTYTNKIYKIQFTYPNNWIAEGRLKDSSGRPLSYSGNDGFFQIGVIEGVDIELDTAAIGEVYKPEKPFGEKPHMYGVKLRDTDGMFILPSVDQDKSFREQAAFIVKYPQPVKIDGISYRYLILYSDEDKIEKIVKSLSFLK